MMKATVYQQPDCEISPRLLSIMAQQGYQPTVIDLTAEPPTRAELVALLTGLEMAPRDILRTDSALYDELALDGTDLDDLEGLAILSLHPVLIQGPILVTEKGVRLCRPVERAYDIL